MTIHTYHENGEKLTDAEELKFWRDNIEYMLNCCDFAIRVRSGGGMESLGDSFIVTFMNMEQKLKENGIPPFTRNNGRIG